ncbi:hypothetical protein DMUE_2328 [Dictyocoela muelleri]|nr:hypothetical protein DMUE_2328 [Dictyocoela muelleri]
MPIGAFNWIVYIDQVVFYYNNTKHTATHCTPFFLFKGFDMRPGFYSTNIVDTIENVSLRIINYTDTYRREYNLRPYDNISVGSIVLVSKHYNVTKCEEIMCLTPCIMIISILYGILMVEILKFRIRSRVRLNV